MAPRTRHLGAEGLDWCCCAEAAVGPAAAEEAEGVAGGAPPVRTDDADGPKRRAGLRAEREANAVSLPDEELPPPAEGTAAAGPPPTGLCAAIAATRRAVGITCRTAPVAHSTAANTPPLVATSK